MTAELHTIVTAGHVDHGKTSLVRALTGVETDRLPEEKRRGLTIALGYAPFVLETGREASIIDAPGHHRFVRTMVSGATGVSGFLMTIAADDGVMPQTIEHADVLAALGVERGIVAITKSDVVDPTPAMKAAEELLPGFPKIACSSATGQGLPELRAALKRLMDGSAAEEPQDRPVTLHTDRVFSIVGSGLVVTGTLVSGVVRAGESLAHVPGDELVRVRQIQVNGRTRERAVAGQRVALNLVGARRRDVSPGDAFTSPGHLRESLFLDCALRAPDLENRSQVHVHHGTRHTPARAFALAEDLWQLRLDQPLLAADGDRVLLRTSNPSAVVGGGLIVDCSARRHGPNPAAIERLRRRQRGEHLEPRDIERSSSPVPVAIDLLPKRAEEISQLARDAGIELLRIAEIDCDAAGLAALQRNGMLIRVSREAVTHERVRDDVQARLVELLEREGAVTLGSFKRHLGVSRRVALAWITHFDSIRVTLRLSDERRIMGPRAQT